jgi:hypothetical protein
VDHDNVMTLVAKHGNPRAYTHICYLSLAPVSSSHSAPQRAPKKHPDHGCNGGAFFFF